MIEKFVSFSTKIGKTEYNELCVSFGYQKPQINYFNGNHESGGVHVYLKPVKRTNGIVSCTMLSASTLENGFKVNAIPLQRKSTKKINLLADCFTEQILERIAENYEKQNFQKVIDIIIAIGKGI